MCTATATSTLFAAAAGLAVVASLGADAAPLSSRGGARKILCLHGGGGNGPSFDYGLTDLQAALPSSAGYEFVFPSAPDGGLWLRDPPNGKGQPTTDPNWGSESLAMLDNIVSSQGPFYGILGYSQGSAFVSAYLAHAPANTFQVAAMFAGYLPTTHLGVLSSINAASPFNNIPAVVFMGGTDTIITNGMTREQASVYTNPLVLRSANAGHIVPSRSDPTFNQVVAFIQDPSSVERPTGVTSTAAPATVGGGKGDSGKGDSSDAGKGGWEQQADGTWVNTATGESFGGKSDGKGDGKGTDGKGDGKGTDSKGDGKGTDGKGDSKGTDDGKGDYSAKGDATTKPPATKDDAADKGGWEQQADGTWINTATGESFGGKSDGKGDGKGIDDGKGDGKGDATKATKAPATKATKAPATKATKAPATKATKPATKATKPATKATKPATKATKPATKATKPATKATKPATKATKAPATKPTKPATKPKHPATKAPATKAPTTACKDDSAWRQAKGRKGKVFKRRTCNWIAKNPTKRCKRVGLDNIPAFAACAKACGTCPM